jgi:endonuclease III
VLAPKRAKTHAPSSKQGPKKAARAAKPKLKTPEEARQVLALLRQAHPDAHCELDHQDPFQLIIATVLSAQSTDVAVNQVTPDLFKRWPDPLALGRAEQSQVEKAIGRLGMFRQKSKNLIGLAQRLVERHGGQVPRTLAELVELPGVGRKTANVVLGVAFGAPEGVVVDTHVQRISQRLGWTRHTDPVDIEQDLMRIFPRADWDILSHTLIFHGRRICTARKPACAACPVSKLCPCAFRAESVGRKPPRLRAPAPPQAGPKRAARAVKRGSAKRAARA